MGLIGKFLGKDKDGTPGAGSTQFRESDPDSEHPGSRNTPRRELVQVVLRDTMRKHGIPSDWVECRMLSSVNRNGKQGLHVNFVVKQAHDRLLAYVFAFQDSFERELTRYEPRARDWLLSIGWEFVGFNPAEMPDPRTWASSSPMPLMPQASPQRPAGVARSKPAPLEAAASDDDLESDLKALFAIRDAAIADTAAAPLGALDHADFEDTRPEPEERDAKK